MWRILQCYNFLIEGQVWGSPVHAQIHWFSIDDNDNAEKNFGSSAMLHFLIEGGSGDPFAYSIGVIF